jgi:hypothetical protein
MNQYLSAVIAGAILLGSAWSAHAQTIWYLDDDALPPGNGTLASPYVSIQYAIDQPSTKSGHTLLLAPGTYHGSFSTWGKALTIRSSDGPHKTRVFGSPNTYAVQLSKTFSIHPTVLEGLTIKGTPLGVDALAPRTTIRRCVLIASWGAVTVGPAVTQMQIESCTIYGAVSNMTVYADYGICGGIVIDSCLFANNQIELGYACDQGTSVVLNSAFDHVDSFPGWTFSSNIIESPDLGLWSPEQLDFHLKPLSPCIDMGSPTLPPDPDGSRADIGALPYNAQYAETPTTYCTSKVHSGGCAPLVVTSGTPSLTGADDFVLGANLALDGMVGKFIWGLGPPQAAPFAGGYLCITPPLVRSPTLFTGGDGKATNCSGTFYWPVDHDYMKSQSWLPGQTLYAQAWGRDIHSPFPEKSQISNAVVFQVLP